MADVVAGTAVEVAETGARIIEPRAIAGGFFSAGVPSSAGAATWAGASSALPAIVIPDRGADGGGRRADLLSGSRGPRLRNAARSPLRLREGERPSSGVRMHRPAQ